MPAVWTVSELAQDLKAGETTIVGLMKQLGHADLNDKSSDVLITEVAAQDLRTFRNAINTPKAAAVLGIRAKFVKELVTLNAVEYALERRSTDGKPLRLFWASDLEEFRAQILRSCRRYKRRVFEHRLPISRAAADVGRSTGQVLAIIKRKAYSWAFVAPNTERLDAIMVDVARLRVEVWQNTGRFGVPQAAHLLGVDRKDIAGLVSLGMLKNRRERNGVNLRWQIVLEADDIDAFQCAYVSVTALSQRKSNVAAWMVKYLDASGVTALPTATKFYLREDLQTLTNIKDEVKMIKFLTTQARQHMADHVWYKRKRGYLEP